jgi:hypothetical protein
VYGQAPHGACLFPPAQWQFRGEIFNGIENFIENSTIRVPPLSF